MTTARSRHPARRGACVRRHPALLAALLVAVFLAPAGAIAEDMDQGSDARRAEASLAEPMSRIAQAFRTGRAESLATLLPVHAKTYLALQRGGATGFFGRDQVFLILRQVFGENATLRFDIRPKNAGRGGARDAAPIVYCVGAWSFRRKDGRSGDSQFLFALSTTRQGWALVEIREAR